MIATSPARTAPRLLKAFLLMIVYPCPSYSRCSMAWRSMVAACSSRNLNSRGRYPEKTGPAWFKTLHEVDGLHSAFTVLAVGEPLLRVARIQSSAAEALSTKATANATTKSVPKSPSVGCGDEKGGEEDQTRRGDGESYGERPNHPLPMKRHPSRANVKTAFDQGDEEQASEESDDHPLGPAGLRDHQPHEQGPNPDHHSDGDEQPSGPAVVGEMPGPDPLHELERSEGQIDAAEDHVQRHDGREVQKPGVVRLLKVVNGRGPTPIDARRPTVTASIHRAPLLIVGALSCDQMDASPSSIVRRRCYSSPSSCCRRMGLPS